MVLDIIISILGDTIGDPMEGYVVHPINRNIYNPIKRHISYPFECYNNVERLRKLTEHLTYRRVKLRQSVYYAKSNGKQINENVNVWLLRAKFEIQEAEELIQGKEQAKKKCFLGLYSNLKTRYQLSKKASEKALAIDKLLNEKKIYSNSFPSKFIRKALPSRALILNQVMNALKDPNLNMIGVHGIGGVGKTTLAKAVHRRAVEEKLFDDVVMVAVSQTPELKTIQAQIAGILGLKFDVDEVPTVRASRLHERLKNSKVLLILDDIWAKLGLNDIGIPFGDECKGCKILLTSRMKDVLSCEMGAQKEFSLEVLREEEALSLFEMTMAGAKGAKLWTLAPKFTKICAGLPLLIVPVARDLRNKKLSAWRDTLKQLSDVGNEELDQKVHKVLKSSYENLPSNEIKLFFLLCASFGQSNTPINHLLRYAMGLGLFGDIGSVQGARDRVYIMIEKLKKQSLLLDGDMNGYVKMHDVVLDFALSIAKEEQLAFFGITGDGLREWPTKDCTRLALPYCDIKELPQGLEYPNAELFSLFNKYINLKIPDLFFEGFGNLKVLNLRGMHFVSLPSSLQFLTKLNSLYLHGCELGDVATVGDMKQLEFLSFADSCIVELPKKIEQLSRLKLLDLSNCTQLKVIPADVLSKLALLEELYMSNSFVEWDVEGNASLMELEELGHLAALEIQVNDANKIPNGRLFSIGLQRYRILIGDQWKWDWDGTYKTSRMLKLRLKTSIHMEHVLKELLRGTEDLYLDEVRGIKYGLYGLDREGFRKLKNLCIQNDDSIRYIINSTMRASWHAAFPILETLSLHKLNSLEEICYGQLPEGSFSKLRILNISGLHKLKNLFSYFFAKYLPQLREVEVNSCDNMETIIGEGREDGNYNSQGIEFTQLCSLTITNLPRLKSICREMVYFPNLISLLVIKCKSLDYLFKTFTVKSLLQLKTLEIWNCELMKEIILTEEFEEEKTISKINFPKLGFLRLIELPKLIRFSNRFIEFQSLKQISISSCPALMNLLSNIFHKGVMVGNSSEFEIQSLLYEMIAIPRLEELNDNNEPVKVIELGFPSKGFPNMKKLVLSGFLLEEIMIHELNICEDNHHESLPWLRKIILCKLPNLKHVVHVDDPQTISFFQNLQVLRVWECHKLEILVSSSVSFQNLMFFEVSTYVGLINLTSSVSFQNLTFLQVSTCDRLINLITTSTAKSLVQLKTMYVGRCEMMQEIVVVEYEGEEDKIGFPRLEYLVFDDLPRLTSFCSSKNIFFDFPCLEEVFVIKCPNMKMFAQVVNTPKLSQVQTGGKEYEWEWKGSLNNTIQALLMKRKK